MADLTPAQLRCRTPRLRGRPWFGALIVSTFIATGCGGPLGHRSTAQFDGQMAIPDGIAKLRIEVPTGTVGVVPGEGRTIRYQGGVRRAADSAANLANLEAIELRFAAAPDAADPTILVVRAPGIPADQPPGVFGLEVGLFVPADLPLEVLVAGNGHVTMADRTAPTRVRTNRGDLRFERCKADVAARTGTGNVIAFDQVGDVDLETGLGDMQVFVQQPASRITLVTGQGTVQCHVPETCGFVVDAVASVGKIGNGFGLEAEQKGYSAELRGSRGDGSLKIVLRTGSGHLSLSPKRWP